MSSHVNFSKGLQVTDFYAAERVTSHQYVFFCFFVFFLSCNNDHEPLILAKIPLINIVCDLSLVRKSTPAKFGSDWTANWYRGHTYRKGNTLLCKIKQCAGNVFAQMSLRLLALDHILCSTVSHV